MSGKQSVNLSISAGGLNLLPNFQKREGGRLGMIPLFRWGLLGKMEVRLFRGGCVFRGMVQFLPKNRLKTEIFNEKKNLLTKMFSSVNLNSKFSYF